MKLRKLVLVLCAILMLASCSNHAVNSGENQSIYAQGLGVISMMHEMASSEEYIKLMLTDPEALEVVASFAEGDYSEPKAVYQVSLSEETLFDMAELSSVSQLPDTLREYLHSRMLSAVAGAVNAEDGMNVLAATAVCTAAKSFVSNELTDDTAYLYVYDDATAVLVSFIVGEGGAVAASGQFIFDSSRILNAPEAYMLVEEIFPEK